MFKSSNLLNNKEIFLSIFIKWSWIILLSASLMQVVFWNDFFNLFAVFVVIIAWKLVTSIVLQYQSFVEYSMSSFVVFGYGLTQFYMPVVFTLIEGKPVIYNLNLPFEVFLHGLVDIIVIVVFFCIYRYINPRKKLQTLQKALISQKFFKAPSDTQIWIMGFIGVASLIQFIINSQFSSPEDPSSGSKFLDGFIPFVYTPYYIFFRKLFSGTAKTIDKHAVLKVGLYTILIFALSIMRNSRGAFMYGFTGLGYGYLIGLFLNIFSSSIVNAKNLVIAVISIWLLTGPLSDLGNAMVIARASRGEVTSVQLLSETLEIYMNKDQLVTFNVEKGRNIREWDETYLDNLYLARFCNLKFNDASLIQAEKLGYASERVRRYTFERVMTTLPQPLIDLFNLDVDKVDVTSNSFGDVLFDSVGGENALGGFRTGHFDGTGMAAFGWWYIIILAFGLIPVYYLIDVFHINAYQMHRANISPSFGVFSLCGLLFLISMFTFIVGESVINPWVYVIRGWIQMVFLYFLSYRTSLFISKLFKHS